MASPAMTGKRGDVLSAALSLRENPGQILLRPLDAPMISVDPYAVRAFQ